MVIFDAESHGDEFYLFILFPKQQNQLFKMSQVDGQLRPRKPYWTSRNIFIEELNLTWLIVYGD